MKIIGIYDAGNGDNQSVYFHHEYLERVARRRRAQGTIGWVVIMRIADPGAVAAGIARTIDALFANSSTETKTATEKAFIQGFANQMGNIGAIVTAIAGAVFFTMLLVTANTMGAVDSRAHQRDRRDEDARLLERAASPGSCSAKSLLVTALGGAIGLRLAALVSRRRSGSAVAQFFPVLGMPPVDVRRSARC